MGALARGHAGHDGPLHELPARLRARPLGDRRAGVARGDYVEFRAEMDLIVGIELPARRAEPVQRLSLDAGEDRGLIGGVRR